MVAAEAPRRSFERLTDPEPVREAYLELCREARDRRRPVPRHRADAPLVSVVVPYYRMDRFVEETIASIAAQTHSPIETIVVDDGSRREEDDRVLAWMAERYPLSVVTQENSGLGQARNLGIQLSRGRYVLPLDPDDVILPRFVERCVEVLEERPELAYVTAWSEYVDERGLPLGAGGYRPLGNRVAWLERENLAGSAMALFRRRLFERGLRYSPDLTSYEDWLMYRELRAGRTARPRDPRDAAPLPGARRFDAACGRAPRVQAPDGRAAGAREGGRGVVDAVERLSLEEAGGQTLLAVTHVHRYEVVAELCAGMRVLDLCCGSGYGTRILAGSAAAVTGVDNHEASIERARADLDREGVAFERGDAQRMARSPAHRRLRRDRAARGPRAPGTTPPLRSSSCAAMPRPG